MVMFSNPEAAQLIRNCHRLDDVVAIAKNYKKPGFSRMHSELPRYKTESPNHSSHVHLNQSFTVDSGFYHPETANTPSVNM